MITTSLITTRKYVRPPYKTFPQLKLTKHPGTRGEHFFPKPSTVFVILSAHICANEIKHELALGSFTGASGRLQSTHTDTVIHAHNEDSRK